MSIDLANHMTHPGAGRVKVTRTEAESAARAKATAENPLFCQRHAGAFIAPDQPLNLKTPNSGYAALSDLQTLRRSDAEIARDERERRLDRLHPAVQALKANLSLAEREALDYVYRASKAAGLEPVTVHRGELAGALGIAPEQAEQVLSDLARRGHVRAVTSFGLPTRYRPQI